MPTPETSPPPPQDATSVLRSVALACIGLALLGWLVGPDPDCDWTLGFDAWHGRSLLALIGAAVALGVVCARPVADRVGGWAARVPADARFPLLLALQAVAQITWTDVSLSGDGLDLVHRLATGEPSPAYPLTSSLHLTFHALGLEPLAAVRATSVVSGLLTTTLTWAAARTVLSGARLWTVVGLVATAGTTALGFGSLEVYAPLASMVALYFLAAVRHLRVGGSAPWPALALGLAATAHGSALLLVPSLLLLAADGRLRVPPLRRLLLWSATAAAPVVVAVLATDALGWQGEPSIESGRAAWGPWTTLGFLPLRRTPETVTERYVLLEWEHTLSVLSLWLLIAAVPLLTLAVSTLRQARESLDGALARLELVAASAAVPLLALPWVWNVSYELRRDWDLFAVAALPTAWWAGLRLLRLGCDRRTAVAAFAVGLFVLLPAVRWRAGGTTERRHFALTLAWHHDLLDEPDVAEYWRARADEHDPDGVLPMIDSALGHLRDERAADAVPELRRVVELAPRDWYARTLLGRALALTGDRDGAESAFRTVLHHPRDNLRHDARVGLAQLLVQSGDTEEALRQLERAVREDSESADVTQVLDEIESLHRAAGRDDVADRYATVRQEIEERRTTSPR